MSTGPGYGSYFSSGPSGQISLPPIPGYSPQLVNATPQATAQGSSPQEVIGANPESCGRESSCGLGFGCKHGSLFECLCEGWENARRGPNAAMPVTPYAPGATSSAPGSMAYTGTPTQPGAAYAAAAASTPPGTLAAIPGTTPTAAPMTAASSAEFGGSRPPSSPSSAPPPVIGDLLSGTIQANSVAPPPGPPGTPRRGSITGSAPIRGFKAAENQSARPIDRVFGDFNYYNNVNPTYNNRTDSTVGHVNIYRQMYGFEKTILDGTASIGMRQSINTINVDSINTRHPSGGMFTGFGYLSVFSKYVLLANKDYSRLLTAGLDLNFPVGPASIGGFPHAVGFRDTTIQPYLAFLWVKDKWFFQGFSSINIATDKNDTTMYFNDLAVGYYLFRAENPLESWLTAVVPTFEVHVNTPLDHIGFNIKVPGSTPDSVNFTMGSTFVFGQRSFLTVAYATPVTGPHPFDNEIIAIFNFRFGGMFKPRVDNTTTPTYSAASVPGPGPAASAPAPAPAPATSYPPALPVTPDEAAPSPPTINAPALPPLPATAPPNPI